MNIRQIIKRNLKALTAVAVILIVTAAGTITYSKLKNEGQDNNITASEDHETNVEIINDNEEPAVKDEETPAPQPAVEVTEKQPQVVETTSKNVSAVKSEPQPAKAVNVPDNTKITYQSKNFGLEFDMPSSWKDKYYISENENTIRVSMKHDKNDEGYGLLFLITQDFNAYDNGNCIDIIGTIDVFQEINGVKYLVGGPTGYGLNFDDPQTALFDTMTSQREDVLKTLRSSNK